MTYQLRIYTLAPGTEEEFVALWRRDLVPLRTRMRFEVVGAWRRPAEHEFTWLVRWTGEGSFADGERAYYEARDQAGLTWNPKDYITDMQLREMKAVDGFAP
jgi:hypothetical protein